MKLFILDIEIQNNDAFVGIKSVRYKDDEIDYNNADAEVEYKNFDLTKWNDCRFLLNVLKNVSISDDTYLITYNGFRYDIPMIALAIMLHDKKKPCAYNTLKMYSDDLIVNKLSIYNVLTRYDFCSYEYNDLITILNARHIDLIIKYNQQLNNTSLKSAIVGMNIFYKNTNDKNYNKHDLIATYKLLLNVDKNLATLKMLGKLQSNEYIVKTTNTANTSIKEYVTKYKYKERVNYLTMDNVKITMGLLHRNKSILKALYDHNKPIIDTNNIKDITTFEYKNIPTDVLNSLYDAYNTKILPYVINTFKKQENYQNKHHHNIKKAHEIKELSNKNAEYKITLDNIVYCFGTGGIHASAVHSTEYKNVLAYDFKSFYPNLIIQCNILPIEMNTHIAKLLNERYKLQKLDKKKYNGEIYNIKIQLNSLYGKTNDYKSKDNPLYNPLAMLKTTINGQFLTLDMIYYIRLKADVKCIYANTDGVMFVSNDTTQDPKITKVNIDNAIQEYFSNLPNNCTLDIKDYEHIETMSYDNNSKTGHFLALAYEQTNNYIIIRDASDKLYKYSTQHGYEIQGTKNLTTGYNRSKTPLIYSKIYEYAITNFNTILHLTHDQKKSIVKYIKSVAKNNFNEFLFYSKPDVNSGYIDNDTFKYTYYSNNCDNDSLKTNGKKITHFDYLSEYYIDKKPTLSNVNFDRYLMFSLKHIKKETKEITDAEIDYLINNHKYSDILKVLYQNKILLRPAHSRDKNYHNKHGYSLDNVRNMKLNENYYKVLSLNANTLKAVIPLKSKLVFIDIDNVDTFESNYNDKVKTTLNSTMTRITLNTNNGKKACLVQLTNIPLKKELISKFYNRNYNGIEFKKEIALIGIKSLDTDPTNNTYYDVFNTTVAKLSIKELLKGMPWDEYFKDKQHNDDDDTIPIDYTANNTDLIRYYKDDHFSEVVDLFTEKTPILQGVYIKGVFTDKVYLKHYNTEYTTCPLCHKSNKFSINYNIKDSKIIVGCYACNTDVYRKMLLTEMSLKLRLSYFTLLYCKEKQGITMQDYHVNTNNKEYQEFKRFITN